MAVKLRRREPVESAKMVVGHVREKKSPGVIRVKSNMRFKVDTTYFEEVKIRSRYDRVKRDNDRQASMELAGTRYSR